MSPAITAIVSSASSLSVRALSCRSEHPLVALVSRAAGAGVVEAEHLPGGPAVQLPKVTRGPATVRLLRPSPWACLQVRNPEQVDCHLQVAAEDGAFQDRCRRLNLRDGPGNLKDLIGCRHPDRATNGHHLDRRAAGEGAPPAPAKSEAPSRQYRHPLLPSPRQSRLGSADHPQRAGDAAFPGKAAMVGRDRRANPPIDKTIDERVKRGSGSRLP